MSGRNAKPRPVLGAALLALGRGDGVALFGNTVRAFLASLVPLVLFALLGAGLMPSEGMGRETAAMLGITLVRLLAPAVLSHAVAARWGREALWLRYATAVNWCQWTLVAATVAMLVVLGGRLPAQELMYATMVVVGLYGLWLNWVAARAGLGLTGGRAALVVLLVNGGTLLLMMLPEAVAGGE